MQKTIVSVFALFGVCAGASLYVDNTVTASAHGLLGKLLHPPYHLAILGNQEQHFISSARRHGCFNNRHGARGGEYRQQPHLCAKRIDSQNRLGQRENLERLAGARLRCSRRQCRP